MKNHKIWGKIVKNLKFKKMSKIVEKSRKFTKNWGKNHVKNFVKKCGKNHEISEN